MTRAHYQQPISFFLRESVDAICGVLASRSTFAVEQQQLLAWREQAELLRPVLAKYAARGHIFFEFVLPRIGRRIDVVLIVDHLVLVLEFKVGEREFPRHAIDQVWDYALDLKNFHEPSHAAPIAPVLIATRAVSSDLRIEPPAVDGVYAPLLVGSRRLGVNRQEVVS